MVREWSGSVDFAVTFILKINKFHEIIGLRQFTDFEHLRVFISNCKWNYVTNYLKNV